MKKLRKKEENKINEQQKEGNEDSIKNRFKARIALGGTIALLGVGSALSGCAPKLEENTQNTITEEKQEGIAKQEDVEIFLETIDGMTNKEERSSYIKTFTKRIIAKEYNEENENANINATEVDWTVERQAPIIVNKDRMGNTVSYTLQEQIEDETAEKIDYYAFTMNGQIVARYDSKGIEIKSSIENNTFFQKVLPLIKEMEALDALYHERKYPVSQEEKAKITIQGNRYKKQIEAFLKQKEIMQKENELE